MQRHLLLQLLLGLCEVLHHLCRVFEDLFLDVLQAHLLSEHFVHDGVERRLLILDGDAAQVLDGVADLLKVRVRSGSQQTFVEYYDLAAVHRHKVSGHVARDFEGVAAVAVTRFDAVLVQSQQRTQFGILDHARDHSIALLALHLLLD